MKMSYRLKISPKSRKAGRFIASVHRNLQKAFLETGLKQQELAAKLSIDRSIVNRRLQGKSNLTLRSIAELAWAMDNDVEIVFSKPTQPARSNGFVSNSDATTSSIDIVSNSSAPVTKSYLEVVY